MQSPTRRDGGYGWVVVFAFFLITFIMDGIRLSFGVLYVEFLEEFGKGKGETAWIGSIAFGVYNIGGPIFATIVSKMGSRTAAVLGGIISCFALVTSYFATEIYHLYLSYGFMLGFGFGLMYLSGSVTVGRYFFKKRALAFGLSQCGSGFGLIAFQPLMYILLEKYTWRGVMFILAGFALNGCVTGALYRPFIRNSEDDNDNAEGDNDNESHADGISNKFNQTDNKDDARIISKDSLDQKDPLAYELNMKHVYKKGNNKMVKSKSKSFADMRKEQMEGYKHNTKTGSLQSINLSSWSFNISQRSFNVSQRSINSVTYIDKEISSISVLSQSMLGSNASFCDILSKKRQKAYISSEKTLLQTLTDNDIDDDINKDVYPCATIENFFPKQLITNINFLLMMLVTFIVGISSFIPFSYIPDYSLHVGCMPSESVWLLSVIGIGGIISRIASGLITDIPGVNRVSFLAVSFMLCGILTLLVPVFTSFKLLVLFSALFGCSFGVLFIVQPVVLFDYFGEEYIAEIMGIIMFTYGVSNLIGSPIAGWIFDATGNYTVSFVFGGVLFMLAGVLQFAVLCTKSSRNARRRAKHEDIMDVEEAVDNNLSD